MYLISIKTLDGITLFLANKSKTKFPWVSGLEFAHIFKNETSAKYCASKLSHRNPIIITLTQAKQLEKRNEQIEIKRAKKDLH